MIRATRVLPARSWSLTAADTVALDHDARHRRRMMMSGEGGLEFLLDLPEAVALRDGDGLVLDDGRIVEVRAALEPLAEITATDAPALMRIAWHLGNRHLPTELHPDRLRIRRDHVIEEMVAGLGGNVRLISASFDPEGGAYGSTQGQARGHAASHGHSHSHSHGDHDHHAHDHGDRHG